MRNILNQLFLKLKCTKLKYRDEWFITNHQTHTVSIVETKDDLADYKVEVWDGTQRVFEYYTNCLWNVK